MFVCASLVIAFITVSSFSSTAHDVNELRMLLENEIEMSEEIAVWEDSLCVKRTVHSRQRYAEGETDAEFDHRHQAKYDARVKQWGIKAQ
jgi:hypothetical protein